jgi:hypothetical protein
MSNYARANTGGATHFGDKDALTTGDPDKVIVGSQFDSEFNAIVTASATKYDSDDLASLAEAQAETVNTKLITPLRLSSWSEANDAVIGDLHALSGQAADSVYGWDNSASAAIGWTIGTGLTSTVGGALEFSHLGIEELSDPGAFDRILFWDDTTTGVEWLQVTNGLEISGTQLGIASSAAGAGLAFSGSVLSVNVGEGIEISSDTVTIADQAVSSTVPVSLTGGTLGWSTSSITTIDVSGIVESQDGVLVQDNGALKVMDWNDGGVHVETWTGGDETQDDTMYSLFMLLTGTTARNFTFTSTGTAPHTGAVILLGSRDTATLTIKAAGTASLTTRYAQGSTADRTLSAGGTCMAVHVGSDEWMLVGDIS